VTLKKYLDLFHGQSLKPSHSIFPFLTVPVDWREVPTFCQTACTHADRYQAELQAIHNNQRHRHREKGDRDIEDRQIDRKERRDARQKEKVGNRNRKKEKEERKTDRKNKEKERQTEREMGTEKERKRKWRAERQKETGESRKTETVRLGRRTDSKRGDREGERKRER
jgi:hypothetical protein